MRTLKSMIPAKKRQIMIMLAMGAMAIFTHAGYTNMSADGDGNMSDQPSDSLRSDLKIQDAIEYRNLQIFPITDETTTDQRMEYLTLAQAIESKKAIVHETSNVNQLSITNYSDEYIFIMAGEIVKGGKQDRTMGSDIIIGPRAGNVPLESYCVEAGRWSQRGAEESDEFSSSSKALSSRDLKLASKYNKDQSQVWSNVDKQQEKLNDNISKMKGEQVEIRSTESGSSLQLALENEDLNDILSEYRDNLKQLDHLPENTIGFAYAINGEVYGIDLFNSGTLFNQLNTKLFESAVIEAIAEYDKDGAFPKASRHDVESLINHTYKDKSQSDMVNTYTESSTWDSEEAVLFETKTLSSEKESWIHRNYIRKSEESKQVSDRNENWIQQRTYPSPSDLNRNN